MIMQIDCNNIPKNVYTAEDREFLHKMLDELMDSGDVYMTYRKAEIDWNLPLENKIKIKTYRLHIGIDD